MDAEIKKQWLARLRDPETKQCQEMLTQTEADGTPSFCCLGVLTNIYADKEHIHFAGSVSVLRDGRGEALPEEVGNWAGITDPSPTVRTTPEVMERVAAAGKYNVTHHQEVIPLAVLNDSGFSFAEIADLIEAQL